MLKKKLQQSECCFCRTVNPEIEPVQKEDILKRYIDTPMKSVAQNDRISQAVRKDKQRNSALKKYTKEPELSKLKDQDIIQTSAINKKKVETTQGILHPKISKKHHSVVYGGEEIDESFIKEEDYELKLDQEKQTYFPSHLAYVIKQKQKQRRSNST